MLTGFIDTYGSELPLYGAVYSYIGYDAAIYTIDGDGELVPISFMDMIDLYMTTGFEKIYYDCTDPAAAGDTDDPLLLKIVVIEP